MDLAKKHKKRKAAMRAYALKESKLEFKPELKDLLLGPAKEKDEMDDFK